jgi:alcohol dehydrogenase (cytochrome c)
MMRAQTRRTVMTRNARRLSAAFALTMTALALVRLAAQSRSAGAPTNSPDDWPAYNRTYAGDRFSPLDQINAANVARLKPVCTFDTGEQVSFETGPLVIGGVMYFTSDTVTYAIDAATCDLKWKQPHALGATSLRVNRGAAYSGGRLFRGAGNGHVIALEAATGKAVWDVELMPSQPGVTVPMAPLAWNGLVFVGNAGGDNFGVTGHVWALDQQDGHTAWRFDVVPEHGPARDSWRNAPGVAVTGGAFWTTFALDPAAGILYVPAGNPAPDFVPEARPGDNLYTNSVIAIEARTGRALDYAQIVKHDTHDWDVSAGPVVLTTRGGRQVIASANKDGLLSAIDRAGAGKRDAAAPGTMPLLWQTATTTRENVEARLEPGRPVRFCPGAQGGTEWNGPAFERSSNLLFVGATDWCTTVTALQPDKVGGRAGAAWSGTAQGFGAMDPAEKRQGWITAIDADGGAVRWRYRSPMPVLGGITPTAGGLLFAGELNGDAIALDAKSGAVLWRNSTSNAIGGGVITYRAGGRQLIAVAAGFKTRVWPVPAESNRVVVFGLP